MIDDRGREVPLCPISARSNGAEKRVRVALQRAESGSKRFAFMRTMSAMLGPPLLMGISLLFGAPAHDTLAVMAAWIAAAVFLGICSILGRTDRVANARRAMLANALCASCGYSLDGSEPQADHCTVCSECGAAWRLATQAEGG